MGREGRALWGEASSRRRLPLKPNLGGRKEGRKFFSRARSVGMGTARTGGAILEIDKGVHFV